MKKKVSLVVGVLIVCIACVYFMRPIIAAKIREYRYNGSQIYYTQILESGAKEKDGSEYLYKCIGIDESGESKNLNFYGMDGKELTMHAYMKINYKVKVGVLGWESVTEHEIPEAVLKKLKDFANDKGGSRE